MRLHLIFIGCCICSAFLSTAQKSKFEKVPFTFFQNPRVPLPDSIYKTYSVEANVPDYMGGSYVASSINYSGIPLKKTATGGDIQVMFNYPLFTEYNRPEQHGQIYTVKANGKDSSYTLYYYTGSFRQGYEMKIRNNLVGKEYVAENDFWMISVQTEQFKTPDEAARQWNVIYKQRISNECANRRKEVDARASAYVNTFFLKGKIGSFTEVYRMKDEDEYPDMDSAFKIAVAAYPLITAEDGATHQKFREAIQPAIDIWKRVLSQFEDSRKARVNKKVANYLLYNLAQAYFWQGRYEQALQCSTQANENGKRDYWVDAFEKHVADTKNRLIANGMEAAIDN